MITTTTFTQIPINIMQEPSDNNSYELIPPSATVSISGSRLNVNATKPEMITLFVTVTPEEAEEAPLTQNTNKGVMNKKIQAKIPTDVTLGTIEPSTVRLITKKVVRTNDVSDNNLLPDSSTAFSQEGQVDAENDSALSEAEATTSPSPSINPASIEK